MRTLVPSADGCSVFYAPCWRCCPPAASRRGSILRSGKRCGQCGKRTSRTREHPTPSMPMPGRFFITWEEPARGSRSRRDCPIRSRCPSRQGPSARSASGRIWWFTVTPSPAGALRSGTVEGCIAGRIPAGSRMLVAAPSTQPSFTTYVSPMMHRSEQIRLGVLRTSPWLWAVALALWLFGKGRARRISSSLALLLVALAFTVSAYSFRWEHWSTWRMEKDLRLWQSAVLSVANLLVVWRSLRGSGAYDPSRCRMCGYDLRATPERCPECGAVPVDPPQAVA